MENRKPTQYIDIEKPLTTDNLQREPKAVSRRDFMTRTAAATCCGRIANRHCRHR